MKTFSLTEIALHNTEKDCWIIFKGKVYDVTDYLADHPGGVEIVSDLAGEDSTEDFEDVGHSEEAYAMLDDWIVGVVGASSSGNDGDGAVVAPAPAPSASAPGKAAAPKPKTGAAAAAAASAASPQFAKSSGDAGGDSSGTLMAVAGVVAVAAAAFMLLRKKK